MQPQDNASTGSVERPRNAKGHKSTCECTLCRRIQERIASGRPSYQEQRATQKANRIARSKVAQQSKKQPNNNRERRIARDAALEASLETQVVLGATPNAKLAGTIAGVEPRNAQLKAKDSDFVQTALEKVGITDDKLATVAAEGLDAKLYKLVFDSDGNVVDNIELPDHKHRHAFWRDLLMAKGVLGEKDERGGGGGGLIIIAPQEAKVIEGHAPACVCEKCVEAWNVKTRVLSRRAANAMAIDADLVENKRALPESLPPDPFEDDDEN